MMKTSSELRASFLLALMGAAVLSICGAATGQDNDLLARAKQLVVERADAPLLVGIAEMYRAAGKTAETRAALERAQTFNTADKDTGARCAEYACWRLLPAGARDLAAFRAGAVALKGAVPERPWAGVYMMCLAAKDGDRNALLAAAGTLKAPESFPDAWAEKCHFDLLTRLGLSPARAGLAVIVARDYQPLHALGDLDKALTREAEFLKSGSRSAEADKLLASRDSLRTAYAGASRRLVERLFALNLQGQTAQRDELAAKFAAIPYLQDRAALADVFRRLNERQAWTLVIQPLMESELELIASPPDLAKIKPPPPAELKVQAQGKSVQGGIATYTGAVKATLGGLAITCDSLAVAADSSGSALLTGSGRTSIRGIPGIETAEADRFTFGTETGTFSLAGAIRLHRAAGVTKLRACMVAPSGEVRDARSLLDDLAAATDVEAKLALLPKIAAAYTDEELSDEAKYLIAMSLLRPQLQWRAYHVAQQPDVKEAEKVDVQDEEADVREIGQDHRWQEAHEGEAWMLDAAQRQALRGAASGPASLPGGIQVAGPGDRCYWRIKDPNHADVVRATRLLGAIRANEADKDRFFSPAQRWLEEIGRNNTVLTLDVAGRYAGGQTGRVVLDVRTADRVDFKLYRVKKAKQLAAVHDRIGEDFVYSETDNLAGAIDLVSKLRDVLKIASDRYAEEPVDLPAEDLVEQWQSAVADLKHLPVSRWSWRHRGNWRDWDDWDEDEEARFYGDACEQYRRRLDKDYRPEPGSLTSWHCDRLVEVPGKALSEAGAYILLAEANGQKAYAPILVEPLSMVLRRCRDGVFVLVSDAEGSKPVGGAELHASRMHSETVAGHRGLTDDQGAAFLRVFGAGDRAIIAAKDGRFAVGGFGRVFDDIYGFNRGRWWGHDHIRKARALEKDRADSYAYADRYLLAAYTDRPTYRPGQEANFKLIVRRMPRTAASAPAGKLPEFRAEDFEPAGNLELPKDGSQARYEVINPRGRVVASGLLSLNDFGTAAWKMDLSSESATGAYSLRIGIGGAQHVLPEVFAVKYYRRPNFEVTAAAELTPLKDRIGGKGFRVTLAGSYYFGKPVAGGAFEVRLVRPEQWKPLAQAAGKLDDAGKASLLLESPNDLPGGDYFVICSVTDGSGRTVTKSISSKIEGPAGSQTSLSRLPRFVAAGSSLKVNTGASRIIVSQPEEADSRTVVNVSGGEATVEFTTAGWYTIQAGDEQTDIFAYGDGVSPWDGRPQRERTKGDETHDAWVNLTDYAYEEDGDYEGLRWDRSQCLWAMFDAHHATVGGKLKVLVYAPAKARLLFTIEEATVADYHVAWTGEKGDYHVVEIPIKPRHAPNFYLQGRIINPAGFVQKQARKLREALIQKKSDDTPGEDPRWCRVDVIDPNPPQARQSLRVRLQADRSEYRPGQMVNVNMKVTDAAGLPVAAELSLAAVDESVFSFGEDRLGVLPLMFSNPRPPRTYYRKTWRASTGGAMAHRLMAMADAQKAQMDLAKMTKDLASLQAKLDAVSLERPISPTELGGLLPVASIPLAELRTDFRETACWLPQIRTGTDGFATATFKLPDSLTAYRLSAVGLTRQTQIGVARAGLKVSMPLSVQVFLPRFAVEGDHLLAVALVHNNTKEDKLCRFEWNLAGGTCLLSTKKPSDGGAVRDKLPISGSIAVRAGQSTRTEVWLITKRVGTENVTFSVSSGADSDAEVRQLPIQALGRARDVFVTGTFTGTTTLRLPEGFTAGRVRLTIARANVARSLDGLSGLVNYPYGCVEQTMSTFLPAVMVKHAVAQVALPLPPDVEKKLPEVLAKGLERLYNFQHHDGGWGWWEKDATNNGMTVYVVYGLARCKAAGATVNEDVLSRGCAYLKRELAEGTVSGPKNSTAGLHVPTTGLEGKPLEARACYAIALAGLGDKAWLEPFAKEALKLEGNFEARCNLALACREVGLDELGERLWAGAKKWEPQYTSELSLKLSAQVVFGAPLADCRVTAAKLLGLRKGLTWEHTRATSWAIEALSQMLGYDAGPAQAAKRLVVTVGGKTVMDIKDAEELRKAVHYLDLSGDAVPQDAAVIEVSFDTQEPVNYVMSASGTQRLDAVEAIGKEVQISRRYTDIDGKELPAVVRVGDVIAARVTVELEKAADYFIIEDRRPAGFEFADDRIRGQDAGQAANVEFRDDRVCAFFGRLAAGRHEIVYYLRAETAGVSHVLPGCAYPMYDDKLRGETAAAKLEVK